MLNEKIGNNARSHVCVCICVCVSARERGREGGRERKRERKKERERAGGFYKQGSMMKRISAKLQAGTSGGAGTSTLKGGHVYT